ncbi:MAG: FliM/FliN family flagellar motor switch protein [Candidatus Hydrogenedentota bacterium]
MNADAAPAIINGFLKGAFDVFEALVSKSFAYTVLEQTTADTDTIGTWVQRYPVCLRTRAQNDVMQAALLFSVRDASRFAALARGTDPTPKQALEQEDRNVLKEVAESALGGGVTSLMEAFGHNVEQLENTEVVECTAQDGPNLMEFLGRDVTGAAYRFEAGDIQGEAVFLYSSKTEDMVPADQHGQPLNAEPASPAAQMLNEASLSQEEMTDILSGFGPEETDAAEQGHTASHAQRNGDIPPANLDMVLDIRLVATARLGSVDLPIGEILSLGPGSIVEVGHLIDEPVELLINDRLIARGDVVVVDEKFGLRITEIISPKERIQTLG